MTLIDLFEVPPEEDEAFLAGFRRRSGTALHRALREDAELRWVAVTRADAAAPGTRAADGRDAAPAAGGPAVRVHSGAYEVVHDEAAVDGEGGVVLIVAFDVPRAGDERFRAGWELARAADAGQGGHLGSRLHRSLGPAAPRWLQLSRWSSPLMVHRARQRPEVRAAAQALPPPAHAALYQVVGG